LWVVFFHGLTGIEKAAGLAAARELMTR